MAKRYQRDAAQLLGRLVHLEALPVSRARRVFAHLLAARLGDVVRLGTTPEAQYALRHDATDADIAAWQRTIAHRLQEDLTDQRPFHGQGLDVERAFIMTTPDGLTIDLDGDLAELLALQASLLARIVGRDRLVRCDCGRIFVRLGKRSACSTRCAKRVYMRRFRAGDAGKE